MSAVIPTKEQAVKRCEDAAREMSAALKDADLSGCQMIDILPAVITVFREEGMSMEGLQLPGLGGLLG